VVPPAALCTDNGAMIAWAGAERLALGLTDTLAAAPHARWLLSDVTGPPLPAAVAAPAQDVAPQARAPEPVQAPVQERPGADAPEPQ